EGPVRLDGPAAEPRPREDRQGAPRGDVSRGAGRARGPAAAPRLRKGQGAGAAGRQPGLGFSRRKGPAGRGRSGCDRGSLVQRAVPGLNRSPCPPRKRRNAMTRTETWLAAMMVAGVATMGSGCGIDEEVHNAALKDRDAQKQK